MTGSVGWTHHACPDCDVGQFVHDTAVTPPCWFCGARMWPNNYYSWRWPNGNLEQRRTE